MKTIILPLWKEDMPFAKENTVEEYEKEEFGTTCAYQITQPAITIYPVQGEPSGQGVLVVPGGGYSLVAVYHEGYQIAQALAEAGITAAVLKYRIPDPRTATEPHNVPLCDARRALALFREQSSQYGFDPHRVGMIGFSAGSHRPDSSCFSCSCPG